MREFVKGDRILVDDECNTKALCDSTPPKGLVYRVTATHQKVGRSGQLLKITTVDETKATGFICLNWWDSRRFIKERTAKVAEPARRYVARETIATFGGWEVFDTIHGVEAASYDKLHPDARRVAEDEAVRLNTEAYNVLCPVCRYPATRTKACLGGADCVTPEVAS